MVPVKSHTLDVMPDVGFHACRRMPEPLKARWHAAEELGKPDALLREDNDFVNEVVAAIVSPRHYISYEV